MIKTPLARTRRQSRRHREDKQQHNAKRETLVKRIQCRKRERRIDRYRWQKLENTIQLHDPVETGIRPEKSVGNPRDDECERLVDWYSVTPADTVGMSCTRMTWKQWIWSFYRTYKKQDG